ncbi:MAG: phospho-N-acetylmuramoyl-pentapeptide-transferase [Candidatus Gastranaerophilales bacterium]|nr:phospho-N-acetylmuramoyl-pentapeptide-transferase [Candidatus Gastranaerophilales bacterium]
MILIIVSALIAIVLSLLFGVVYVHFLQKGGYNQYILDVAPENHAKKAGTPTTGGVFIVVATVLASIIALLMEQKLTTPAAIILMAFVFYAFAGFKDDIQKIKNKQNKGLTAKGKLFLQIVIALLPALYMTVTGHTNITLGGWDFNLGWFYPFFAVFVITGVSNAVNLTDGLDGLAASNVVIAMAACAIIATFLGNIDIGIIAAATAGASAGFLYFNKYPAKVFMGDTGSLALGGMLGTLAVMGKFELWLIPIGIIFFCETMSVILQVASYKFTGNRIFKMSPIHHHFELCGWKETKIVAVFTAITTIFCILAVILFLCTFVG